MYVKNEEYTNGGKCDHHVMHLFNYSLLKLQQIKLIN